MLARKHGPLALLQLDAHGDTWDEYFGQRYFHGTTFLRALEEKLIEPAASVQAGLRGSLYGAEDLESARAMGFAVLPCDQLRTLGPGSFASLVRERAGRRPIFLSFDVDVLDPAFAPGTGTPEVGGLSTAEALAFLRALGGIDLAGADVVEVSPSYDGPGQQTALAAANVAYELLSLRALSNRSGIAEAEREAAPPSPRIDRDHAEAVRAPGQRARVEAEAHLHRAGLPAVGLHELEDAGLEEPAEAAALAEDRDDCPVRACHRPRDPGLGMHRESREQQEAPVRGVGDGLEVGLRSRAPGRAARCRWDRPRRAA